MNAVDALATATTLGLVGMGVVTPTVFVIRAIRAQDPFDRPFLLAAAVGSFLWILLLLAMYAHDVAPDSAMPSWISGPLESYGSATSELYKSRDLYILWTCGSIFLLMLGAVATPTRRQRASRRLPE